MAATSVSSPSSGRANGLRPDSARWPVPPQDQDASNAPQQPFRAALQQERQLRRQRHHRQHPRVLTRARPGVVAPRPRPY